MKVWTKICGIRSVPDAVVATEAGADAIGVNFCRQSVRYCEPAAARRIVAAVGSQTTVFGVFVDLAVERVAALARELGLGGVQLHGRETDAFMAQLRIDLGEKVAIVRAIPVASRDAARAALAGARGHRVLLDSPRGGGSGARFDATLVKGLGLSEAIVAGGLTPENVAEVVRELEPYGVDTAGGVESAPGVKDHDKIREFLRNANSSAA